MESKDRYDFLLKFIIIGNSSSGKSCLLHYFLENKCTLPFRFCKFDLNSQTKLSPYHRSRIRVENS